MEKWPIGVFASIDAGLGVKLEVAHELGVPTIQLHAPQQATRTRRAGPASFSPGWRSWASASRPSSAASRARATPTFPPSTRTVGLVPPATRAARTKEMKEIADFARLLGVDVVALHLGFVPHDTADPLYREVLAVTRDLCDHCRGQRQALHLETGQEPADTLLQFIGDVERDNLFVNFDPANMILYGSGEPIAALRKGRPLRPQRPLQGRHVGRPARPGVGRRSAAGRGRRRHGKLPPHARQDRLRGPLTIEREIPQEPAAAKGRNRPRARAAARAEGQDRLTGG